MRLFFVWADARCGAWHHLRPNALRARDWPPFFSCPPLVGHLSFFLYFLFFLKEKNAARPGTAATLLMTTISALPDDVLHYILDAYVDDRSLGACLLAWRRFHVLGPARLLQRKYRLATVTAVCAAGDVDGLEHVLRYPNIFGNADNPEQTRIRAQIAQSKGYARVMMRLLQHEAGFIGRFTLPQWYLLALTAALRGCDDADFVWLCLPENRPVEKWHGASLVYGCARHRDWLFCRCRIDCAR
nr:hypothetical protein [Pandoravirus massiliensis]